jgi:hypothetical protein
MWWLLFVFALVDAVATILIVYFVFAMEGMQFDMLTDMLGGGAEARRPELLRSHLGARRGLSLTGRRALLGCRLLP